MQKSLGVVVFLAAALAGGRAGEGPVRRSWLLVIDDAKPDRVRHALLESGARILRQVDEIGVLVVSGAPTLEVKLHGLAGVEVAPLLDVDLGTAAAASPVDTAAALAPSSSLPVDDDLYFAGQWSLRAIDAPGAWAQGQRGRGVRVAILDTGVDPTHPDLAAAVNTTLARSFVPGQSWDVSLDPVQSFDHGTHVAGIIAGADNGFGIIGVAPEAEIVPISVLPRPGGHGPPDAVIEGIVYAANIGAHVINMSVDFSRFLRGGVNDRGTEDPGDDVVYTAREAAALKHAFARATNYAHSKGCTLVASGGNDAIDADDDGSRFVVPRDAPHVLGVAATGPLSWALNPGTDVYRPASYTDHGRSAIDLAAPGGDVDFGLLGSGAICSVAAGGTSVTLPCWFFDGVVGPAPVKGGYFFEFRRGTSMAAAHVSGVAALVIGSRRGSVEPDWVAARLRASAIDLGEKGRDPYYGFGFVNAARAVSGEAARECHR